MNVDYSYVGVPATPQEIMTTEDHDHPVESRSETLSLAGSEAPAAPALSAPTVVGSFLLSIAQNLTSWSKGMEISHNAHRSARSCYRSCVGPSHF